MSNNPLAAIKMLELPEEVKSKVKLFEDIQNDPFKAIESIDGVPPEHVEKFKLALKIQSDPLTALEKFAGLSHE